MKVLQASKYAVLGLSLSLTACQTLFYGEDAWIPLSSEFDYLHSHEVAPLTVPANLSSDNIEDYFVIPKVSDMAANYPLGESLNLEPPIIILANLKDTSVIEQAGRQVLIVKKSKEQVWNELLSFLQDQNIVVRDSDKAGYELLTDWVYAEDDNLWHSLFGSSRPKQTRKLYKFDISDGPMPDSSMIVSEQLANQAIFYASDEVWQTLNVSNNDEVSLLNQFIGFVENLTAQQQKDMPKRPIQISMSRAYSGHIALQADSEFDELWLLLPQALEVLGFDIDDKDRSLGLYYVELDRSNFKLPWTQDDKATLPLEDGQYRIQLGDNGKMTSILLLDEDNQPLDAHTVQLLVQPFLDAFSVISKN